MGVARIIRLIDGGAGGGLPPTGGVGDGAPTYGDDALDSLIFTKNFDSMSLAAQGAAGNPGGGWILSGHDYFGVVDGPRGGSSRAIRAYYGTPGGAPDQENIVLEYDCDGLSTEHHWFIEWYARWSVGADPAGNGADNGFKYTRFFFSDPGTGPRDSGDAPVFYCEYAPNKQPQLQGYGGGYDEARLGGSTRVLGIGGEWTYNTGAYQPCGWTYDGDADPSDFPWYAALNADDKRQEWPLSTWTDGNWHRHVYEFHGNGLSTPGYERFWIGDTKILDRSGLTTPQYLPESSLTMVRFFMNLVGGTPDLFTLDIGDIRAWERND